MAKKRKPVVYNVGGRTYTRGTKLHLVCTNIDLYDEYEETGKLPVMVDVFSYEIDRITQIRTDRNIRVGGKWGFARRVAYLRWLQHPNCQCESYTLEALSDRFTKSVVAGLREQLRKCEKYEWMNDSLSYYEKRPDTYDATFIEQFKKDAMAATNRLAANLRKRIKKETK